MSLAAFLSLALMSADPSGFQLAQVSPPTSQGPVSTGQSAADEARGAAAAEGDPIPSGAPTDDYGFVAWCTGALSEHMSLRPRVWSDIERIERQFPDPDTPVETALASYDEQQKEGEQEMASFTQALDIADAHGAAAAAQRGADVEMGRSIWKGAQTADTRQLAQLWMSWALPPRCQTAANRLSGTQ